MYSWVEDDGKGRGMWEVSVPSLQFCREIYLKINWGHGAVTAVHSPCRLPSGQSLYDIFTSWHKDCIPLRRLSLPVDNENVPYFPKTTYQNCLYFIIWIADLLYALSSA